MFYRIVDSCPKCMSLEPHVLRPASVKLCVVHRISLKNRAPGNPNPIPDDQLTGVELARRFTDPVHGKLLGTGGRPPYHALVRTDAAFEQMLPLITQGQHAKGYNGSTWAIAVVGNHDEREMSDRQWMSLVKGLSVLAVLPRKVRGHTELDGASSDPEKRCPGKFVNMDWVRSAVDKSLPPGSDSWNIRRRLAYIAKAGFTL